MSTGNKRSIKSRFMFLKKIITIIAKTPWNRRNKVNTELYEKIVSKSSSGDCSGRKLGQESNQLKKDLQKLLWKKNYDFKKCDAIIDREFKERNKRADEEKRNG